MVDKLRGAGRPPEIPSNAAPNSADRASQKPAPQVRDLALPAPGAIARTTGHEVARQAAPDAGRMKGPTSALAVRASLDTPPTSQPSLRFAKHSGPSVSFPLSQADAQALISSDAVSPFVPSNPRVIVHPTDLEPPTHPGDAGYFAELGKVLDVQIARAEGKTVEHILGDRVPKLFEGYTLQEAAEAVHTDLPTDWPTALFKQFLSEGAKFDSSVVPHLCGADFVNTIVTTAGVLGMATAAVSPSAFACKWHEGRARPEEAIWAIRTGALEGAPEDLQDKVKSLGLKSAESFTAYPEGSPKHPSWPAMHSAASISSMVLAVLLDLSPEQLTESRNMDYAVSTFRTAAGVHFESDNLAGLKIGQMAIEAWLPDFLAEYAGADPEQVKAKIEQIKYDWDQHPRLFES